MDKNYLIKSAEDIISEIGATDNITTLCNELETKSILLVDKINTQLLSRADIDKLIGNENINMMKDNHANHLRFIISILKEFNAEVLVETILWVFRAYQSHGFASNYWSAQLNAWIEIYRNNLEEDNFKIIYPLYNWMQINIALFANLSKEELNQNGIGKHE